MAGKLTFARARELRADALDQMKFARRDGRPEWAEAQRKRVDALDEYLALNFRPDGGRRDRLDPDAVITPRSDPDDPQDS